MSPLEIKVTQLWSSNCIIIIIRSLLKEPRQGLIAHFQDTSCRPDDSHFYVLLVIFQGIHHFVSFVTSLLIRAQVL